jgi:hypothetical protein
VKIYNLLGKEVFKSQNQNIDISNLKKGVYILKIVTLQGELRRKIIKE